LEDLEKNNGTLLSGTQTELKKEMAMLQKKIMMETVSYYDSIEKIRVNVSTEILYLMKYV
jgi:hypothetical protein